jgi:hypothetical protein
LNLFETDPKETFSEMLKSAIERELSIIDGTDYNDNEGKKRGS